MSHNLTWCQTTYFRVVTIVSSSIETVPFGLKINDLSSRGHTSYEYILWLKSRSSVLYKHLSYDLKSLVKNITFSTGLKTNKVLNIVAFLSYKVSFWQFVEEWSNESQTLLHRWIWENM